MFKSRVITGNPVGWTIHEFDHAATDNEVTNWASQQYPAWDGKLFHTKPDVIPPYRYLYFGKEFVIVREV